MTESNLSIAARVASLPELPTAELWSLWDTYFPRRPENTNREYLESRIAYKLQEEAYGGLSAATAERLAGIGAQHSKIKARSSRQEIVLAPGTVLIREFGNQEHRVTVTASGMYDYAGKTFKSLSAIARHITGTPWSGPVFFGLRGGK